MQVEIKIDENTGETKVIVIAKTMSEEVSSIIKKLSEESSEVIAGFKDEKLKVINPEKIIRAYAADGKVYVLDEEGEYRLRIRLYELEERLSGKGFLRISNSEIVNINKIKEFDLSISGTICISFKDGTKTYASRRYVSGIKRNLGI